MPDPAAGTSRSYSSAAQRWVPVDYTALSPDGLSYAYIKRDPNNPDFTKTELHVVDMTSGLDSKYVLSQGMLGVVRYTRDAIYLQWQYEVRLGLLRFDLASHSLAKVSDRDNIWITDGAIAWGGTVNPADPHPIGGMQNQPNEIDRLDLSTGASEPWLYRPGSSVQVLMTDLAGEPVVWIGYGEILGSDQSMPTDKGELVRVDRPNHVITLFKGKATFIAGIADQHGTWVGGSSGIFLLKPDGTFRNLSAAVAEPVGACQ